MSSAVPWYPGLIHAIQHQAVCSDQEAIITLLCTSKQLSTAVKQACKALVPIRCRFSSLQEAKLFANWLVNYGSIAKHLDIGPYEPKLQIGARRDVATRAIACALNTALSPSPKCFPGSSLQHVVLEEVANDPFLIEQLALCSQLTSLQILLPRYGKYMAAATGAAIAPASLVPGLEGLTTLRKLILHSRWHPEEANTDELIPALKYLTNLTFLSLMEPDSQTALQLLPEQLQHLQLIPREGKVPAEFARPRQPMELNHLTALTAISYCEDIAALKESGNGSLRPLEPLSCSFADFAAPADAGLVVHKGHRWPPLLQELTVGRVYDAGPLQQLSGLQHLHITSPNQPTDVLLQLPQHCKHLTSVQLRHFHQSVQELKRAAGAWRALPLTAITVHCCELNAWCLQQIAQVGSLTRLQLRLCYDHMNMLPLAAALQHLTRLQKLELRECSAEELYANRLEVEFEGMQITTEPEDTYQQLYRAVADLQQLQCFAYFGYWDSISQLADATQLTALGLCDERLDDKTISFLAGRLTGLRELNLSGNKILTLSCLQAISRKLQQLTYLDLCETEINQVTVGQFLQLRVLRMGPSVPEDPHRNIHWQAVEFDLDP